MSKQVISIPPFHYVHILNKNDNKIRLEEGPKNLPLKEDEELLTESPLQMLVIPNLCYIQILNPVLRDENKSVVFDKTGLSKYRWSKTEYRTREDFQAPFPLYYEEIVLNKNGKKVDLNKISLDEDSCSEFILPLKYVPNLSYLILQAKVKFTDKTRQGDKVISTTRNPGDEWIFYGPNYYLPSDELEILKEEECLIIKNNQALVLKAKKDFTDKNGIKRRAGDRWLMREKGAYLPDVQELVEKIQDANVIYHDTSLLLRAIFDFVDFYGIARKAGEEWLITNEITNTHIIDVFETLVQEGKKTILKNDEYCIICDPYDEKAKTNLMGTMRLVKGVDSFFLQPGERLKSGVEKVHILDENEGFLVQSIESFVDENSVKRNAGDKWMINGPLKFIPGVQIKIIEKRQKIPLDKNEGIYIRNVKTGRLFKHMGSSYFLSPDEELWEKQLPENIETIYRRDQNIKSRNKSRIVSYSCPFNCIMQIYNLKTKTNRIIFGPDLAVLDPEEEFTIMHLSGKTPKVSGVVSTLCIKLGPVFSSDEFTVETIDHTKLRLKVSYDWIFDINNGDVDSALKIFTIRDFVGDMVKTLASRIRSTTATISFEDFHKNSDLYIRKSVFGEDASGKLNKNFKFEDSNLLIRHVDIQSVSPIDCTTKELLQKSVSLAIELTTKTYEQEFQIQALIKEQEFKGEVEKLRIQNEIDFIKKEIDLNKLKVESNIIEKNGLSRAEALAFKEAIIIESKSKVDLAEMNIDAQEQESEFNIKKMQKEHDSNFKSIFLLVLVFFSYQQLCQYN